MLKPFTQSNTYSRLQYEIRHFSLANCGTNLAGLMASYLCYLCVYEYACVFVYQQYLSELREHVGRSIKTSVCVPVTAHASTSAQSESSEVVAVACLINKRSILSRSVLCTCHYCEICFFCSSFTSRSSVLSLYTYQHFMCKEYYCLSAKKPSFSSHGDRQLVQHQFTVAIIPWWNVWKWSFWTVFIIIITITTTVIDSLTLPT